MDIGYHVAREKQQPYNQIRDTRKMPTVQNSNAVGFLLHTVRIRHFVRLLIEKRVRYKQKPERGMVDSCGDYGRTSVGFSSTSVLM